MKRRIQLSMEQQPDDYTCGPTCLHAVYNYFGNPISLDQVISEVAKLDDGGTLGVLLANHALKQGYQATIFTYNLRVFDPTWFELPIGLLPLKLQEQMIAKAHDYKLVESTKAYIDFLQNGGEIRFKELNPNLIRYYLKRDIPILTGLSSTYLYNCARERDENDKMVYDDVAGESTGHFVVLSGYNLKNRTVQVADPYSSNPKYSKHYYNVRVERLVNSILLGILTYDANLLVIERSK
jgi:predicted double-glycine peptidase